MNQQDSKQYIEQKCIDLCNTRSCCKLKTSDWLDDVNQGTMRNDIIEIRFKNTRKEFFYNINKLNLKVGDIVAVEALPGHDIGTVSMVGHLVKLQMKKNNVSEDGEFKKIYRKARATDIEKWKNATDLESATMLRARKIADRLNLKMKIGDVEYQGDGTKAIFYYIADERVDFRELIKIFAEKFKVRIEMKQIGARQEAGRIGGIGPCGREICCSTWMHKFVSVNTTAAKEQDLSLNTQKLAGQCGKLKCCLNYEHKSYVDAQKDFPDTSIVLQTKKGKAFHQKTDIYKRLMWYSIMVNNVPSLVAVSVERVKEIIELNKQNIVVERLLTENNTSTIDILADVDKYRNKGKVVAIASQNEKKQFKPKKRKVEVGSRKVEVGSRKTEVGSRKTEVGSRKTEVGSRKTGVGRRKQRDVSRKSEDKKQKSQEKNQ